MTEENEEQIAPVIPLFGSGDVAAAPGRRERSRGTGEDASNEHHPAGKGAWASAARAASSAESPGAASSAESSGAASAQPRLRALRQRGDDSHEDADDVPLDPAEQAEKATEALVRKLRTRSLSVAEASVFLRGQHLGRAQVEQILDEFLARKYLDDRMLASHLVVSGHERKGQGRIALSRILAQRGIPRDIADAALEELPDDDFERALEFARGKMRSMARLDEETAKRRLSGQLARRGYPGALVGKVVRQAMQEQSFGSGSTRVRFD
ncbi:regulatory protein RecX [Microbacterium sp. NPDC055903]